jgi:hypothetical protein
VIPCQVNLALRHDGWLSHDKSAPGMEPPSKRPRRLSDKAREMAEIADQKNADKRNPVRDRKDAKRHKVCTQNGTSPRASLAASAASTPAREYNPFLPPETWSDLPVKRRREVPVLPREPPSSSLLLLLPPEPSTKRRDGVRVMPCEPPSCSRFLLPGPRAPLAASTASTPGATPLDFASAAMVALCKHNNRCPLICRCVALESGLLLLTRQSYPAGVQEERQRRDIAL